MMHFAAVRAKHSTHTPLQYTVLQVNHISDVSFNHDGFVKLIMSSGSVYYVEPATYDKIEHQYMGVKDLTQRG